MNRLHFLGATLAVTGLLLVVGGCDRDDAQKARDKGRDAANTAQNWANRASNAMTNNTGSPYVGNNVPANNMGSPFMGNEPGNMGNQGANQPANNGGSGFVGGDQDIVATLQGKDNFKTLTRLIEAAGLSETLKQGEYTVFAPTDDAFKQANLDPDELSKPENKDRLTKVLQGHVVKQSLPMDQLGKQDKVSALSGQDIKVQKQGENIMVGEAKVSGQPTQAKNGVIYEVDKVIMAEGSGGGSSYAGGDQDIVATLQGKDNFKTLARLIQAAGLSETLKQGEYTVFAPTDDAFKQANLDPDELSKPENKDRLTKVLQAHVVKQNLSMDQLGKQDKVSMLSGQDIKVQKQGENIMVGEAKVSGQPTQAKNGMIYQIDKVIMAEGSGGTSK